MIPKPLLLKAASAFPPDLQEMQSGSTPTTKLGSTDEYGLRVPKPIQVWEAREHSHPPGAKYCLKISGMAVRNSYTW